MSILKQLSRRTAGLDGRSGRHSREHVFQGRGTRERLPTEEIDGAFRRARLRRIRIVAPEIAAELQGMVPCHEGNAIDDLVYSRRGQTDTASRGCRPID